MFLDSNKKLVVVLATAKTTLNMPVTVDYVDLTSIITAADSTQAYTNGTTAVDILAAPAASTIRKVNGLLLYGRDTLAKTVKIYSVDATPTTGLITAGAFVAGNDYQIVSVGTTDFTLIGASANTIGVIFTATGVGTGTGTAATSYPVVDVTLQVDDTLGYTDSNGWYTLDMSGNLKTVVGTSESAIADAIHNSTSKATPVDADEIGIWDSVSGLLNKLTWANLKTTLGTTFSALAGSASQVFSVAAASAAAHAVRSDQLSTDNTNFPIYTAPATWTPVDSSGAGLTFTSVNGYITKIGKLRIARCSLIFPVTADGSNVNIGGLPDAAGSYGPNSIQGFFVGTSTITSRGLYNAGGASSFTIDKNNGAAVAINSDFSGCLIYATLFYEVA